MVSTDHLNGSWYNLTMKYLGVDYGLKKIGLAVSQGMMAHPLQVLHVSSLKDALAKVTQVIKAEEVDLVVVGMPESGTAARIAKSFINGLKKTIQIQATDETLTSQNATNLMLKLGIGQKSRQKEDAYSAALILQDFLDNLNEHAKEKSPD